MNIFRFYKIITRYRITKLLYHIQMVDHGLRQMLNDETIIPSPQEMSALEKIDYLAQELPQQIKYAKTTFWQRIRNWQNTPYSKTQRNLRNIIELFVTWLVLSLVLYNSGLWVVEGAFINHWQFLLLDGLLAGILILFALFL